MSMIFKYIERSLEISGDTIFVAKSGGLVSGLRGKFTFISWIIFRPYMMFEIHRKHNFVQYIYKI